MFIISQWNWWGTRGESLSISGLRDSMCVCEHRYDCPSVQSSMPCPIPQLLSHLAFVLRPTGEKEVSGRELWDVTLNCSAGKRSSWLQKWGDGVSCRRTKGLQSICGLSMGAAGSFMVAESKRMTWGWGVGMEMCFVTWAPLYQPFWWGFHFRLPVRKSSRM